MIYVDMLRDPFYVDNLIKISDFPEELIYLYKRMHENNGRQKFCVHVTQMAKN